MSDLIDRRAAIDAITAIDEGDNIDISTNEVRELLRELPSAQPVRKGTWVSHWEHCEREKVLASGLTSYFWCSVCNMPSPAVTNFCPNCGAFMSEGETDD